MCSRLCTFFKFLPFIRTGHAHATMIGSIHWDLNWYSYFIVIYLGARVIILDPDFISLFITIMEIIEIWNPNWNNWKHFFFLNKSIGLLYVLTKGFWFFALSLTYQITWNAQMWFIVVYCITSVTFKNAD